MKRLLNSVSAVVLCALGPQNLPTATAIATISLGAPFALVDTAFSQEVDDFEGPDEDAEADDADDLDDLDPADEDLDSEDIDSDVEFDDFDAAGDMDQDSLDDEDMDELDDDIDSPDEDDLDDDDVEGEEDDDLDDGDVEEEQDDDLEDDDEDLDDDQDEEDDVSETAGSDESDETEDEGDDEDDGDLDDDDNDDVDNDTEEGGEGSSASVSGPETGGSGIRGVPSGGGGDGRDPDEASTRTGEFEDDFNFDDEGNAIRAGEVLAFDLDADERETVEELGFEVVEVRSLGGLDETLTILKAPEGLTASQAEAILENAVPDATFEVNYIYSLQNSKPVRFSPPTGGEFGDPSRGRGAAIAMIDTPVDRTHPALKGRALAVRDFAKPGAKRDRSHGTAVASILIGYDEQSEYSGVAPGAKLFAANVFTIDENGAPETDAALLIRALDWAASKDAGVINMSIAGPESALLGRIIEQLTNRGHIIVAAVGNDGPAAPPLYPAAYDPVVAVTAVDKNETVYRRAGRGPHVDLAALGVDMRAASAEGGYDGVSGTSFATPIVSASLALQMPRPSPDMARKKVNALLAGAKDLGAPGRDVIYGAGLFQPDNNAN